jgi:hypothetical protein
MTIDVCLYFFSLEFLPYFNTPPMLLNSFIINYKNSFSLVLLIGNYLKIIYYLKYENDWELIKN